MNRMTEALAVEWARFNINVNGIAPGAFALRDDGRDDRRGSATSPRLFPRKRLGDPAQLDCTLLYLVLAGVGVRHRHRDQGRRRPRLPLITDCASVPGPDATNFTPAVWPKRTRRPGVAPVGSPSA